MEASQSPLTGLPISPEPQKETKTAGFFSKQLKGFSPLGKAVVAISSVVAGIVLPVLGGVLTFWATTSLGQKRIKQLEGKKSIFFITQPAKGVDHLSNFVETIKNTPPSLSLLKEANTIGDELFGQIDSSKNRIEIIRSILSPLYSLSQDHPELLQTISTKILSLVPKNTLQDQPLKDVEEFFSVFEDHPAIKFIRNDFNRTLDVVFTQLFFDLNQETTDADFTKTFFRIKNLYFIFFDYFDQVREKNPIKSPEKMQVLINLR